MKPPVYPTRSPASSASSFFPAEWSQHVLQKRYRDPMRLKQTLDDMYGPGQYKVMVMLKRTAL